MQRQKNSSLKGLGKMAKSMGFGASIIQTQSLNTRAFIKTIYPQALGNFTLHKASLKVLRSID